MKTRPIALVVGDREALVEDEKDALLQKRKFTWIHFKSKEIERCFLRDSLIDAYPPGCLLLSRERV